MEQRTITCTSRVLQVGRPREQTTAWLVPRARKRLRGIVRETGRRGSEKACLPNAGDYSMPVYRVKASRQSSVISLD
jgi:hypothetical protein